jgi:predicted Zn-dependent protease
MLDKIQKDYKFQEFQKLMDIEKNNVLKKNAPQCLVESGANTSINSNLRSQATLLAQQGKYGEAINKLNVIIQSGKATVSDYNTIGSYYIFTKQYDKAVKFLKEGERFDDSELLIKLNLAHAYLLNDNYKEAKIIYKKYQTQNVTDSLSWINKIKIDFEAFQKAGIQNEDYDRVLKLIEK